GAGEERGEEGGDRDQEGRDDPATATPQSPTPVRFLHWGPLPHRVPRPASALLPHPAAGDVVADACLLLRPRVEPAQTRRTCVGLAGPRVDEDDVAHAAAQQQRHRDDQDDSEAARQCLHRFHQPPPSAWNSAAVSANRLAWTCTRMISACWYACRALRRAR